MKFQTNLSLLTVCFTTLLSTTAISQEMNKSDVPLFFREEWKEIPAQIPVTQEHVQNQELLVSRHGPDADAIKKSHHDNIPNDPYYIWSGNCKDGKWAISLRKKDELVDLREGWFRWRVKQSGRHILYIILELEDGSWIIGQPGFGETPRWHVFEEAFAFMNWYALGIESIERGKRIDTPDLSQVRSVGWTDLQIGEGSPGCTRVDWIEVYGKSVE